MSVRPDAPKRAGIAAAGFSAFRFCSPAALVLAAGLLFSAPTSAGAQSAKDVLKKAEDLYKNVKSFSGKMRVVQSGKGQDGKPASVTVSRDIAYKAPNLFKMSIAVQATGPNAAKAAQAGGLAVSDGKTMYQYSPSRKEYAKQAAPPSVPLAQLLGVRLPGADTPNAKLGAPVTVLGRQAFVVEIKLPTPPLSPQATPADKKKYADFIKTMKPLQVMIDKQNYQLLQIKQSAGGNSQVIELSPQTVNGAVADAQFKFTPPAGSKEAVRPQVPPGAPGTPGAPGKP